MLRVQPESPATPIASVVVLFDHPVAPRFDKSVDPTSVLRIVPDVRAHIYWRDPSTIVADFDLPWAAGTTYEVRIDPSLRSEAGLPLAKTAPLRIQVSMPRVLALLADARDAWADTVLHPVAMYSHAFDPAALDGHLWVVPVRLCGQRDSIPMRVARMRAVNDSDSWQLQTNAARGGSAVDAPRQVIEFTVPGTIPRGCGAELHVPKVVGQAAIERTYFRVRDPFRFEGTDVASVSVVRGPITLRFSNEVLPADVEASVRIDGRPVRVATTSKATEIVLLDSIKSRQRRQLTLSGTMRNVTGDVLGKDFNVMRIGAPIEPGVGFASQLMVMPRSGATLVRVRHVNADSMLVIIGRVRDAMRSRALADGNVYFERVGWKDLAGDTVTRSFAVRAPQDSEGMFAVPATAVPMAWRTDPLLLVRAYPIVTPPAPLPSVGDMLPAIIIRAPGGNVIGSRFATILRSDIAAHAIASRDVVDAWITSLRDARPIAAARVRVLDDSSRVLASGITDARGRVHLTGAAAKTTQATRRILEATVGDDRTMLLLPEMAPVAAAADEDTWNAYGPASRTGETWLHGSAFTERGIYRPGERVFLSGAVRTFTPSGGYRTPSGDSARFAVWFWSADGESDRVFSRDAPLSDFGTAADSFVLGATARLGNYFAVLSHREAGTWREAARTSFRVAEYRAPEFAVKATSDTATRLFGGDTATVDVSGRYLFGIPLAGAKMEWWSNVEDVPWWAQRVRGLESYRVGRTEWFGDNRQSRANRARADSGVLLPDGSLRIRVPLPALDRPATLHVAVTATDVNRQAVTANLALNAHAANAYLGMRTRGSRWLWKAKDSVVVEMLVVSADGTVRSGEAITLVALRRRFEGNRWVADTVWRGSETSATNATTTAFIPGDGGSYELLGRVTDERGRTAETSLDVWVSGGTPRWDGTNPRALAIRSVRTRFAPGEVAQLILESPAEEHAWLTVRGEGMLSEQFVTLRAGINALSVPIPPNAESRATVYLRTVRAFGANGGADSAGIYTRSGMIALEVDSTLRSLHVAITPASARYQPRDTVRVALDVRDVSGKGQRADVAVWAVDEGVIALTDFVRPAILAALLAMGADYPWTGSTLLALMMYTPPGVAPVDLYGIYGSSAASSSVRIRGASSSMRLSQNVVTGVALESPAPGEAPRSVFATTAFFAGHVRADAAGRAQTSFVLPDNIGAYRIFAAAVGEGVSAGSSDTSIVTTRPLVVRPALPRVVRVGDELFAGAALTLDRTSRTPVSLTVEATNVELTGATTTVDTLDARRSRELRFPMRVLGGDSVSFIFRGSTLSGAPLRDAVEARLAVSPPGRARAHVVTGMVRRTDDVILAVPDGMDTLKSRVTMQIGASPLPLVRQFGEALRIYPYYCTEQVSSAGRGLLARLELERTLDSTTSLSSRDRDQLTTAVATLVGRQRNDGGFGYWNAGNWTSPWLTAYALDFIHGARRAGIDVPEGALRRAEKYLAATTTSYRAVIEDSVYAWRDSIQWPHEALAAAASLRRAGRPDTPLEQRVWTMQDRLDYQDRLSLALLAIDSGDSLRARALLDAAWKSAHLDGRRITLDDSANGRTWLFRSTSRPIALLLSATTRIQPTHPMLGALFESVVQSGRSETSRWWNTLDQATVAEALTVASSVMQLASERTITVSGARGGAVGRVTLAKGRTDSLTPSLSSLTVQSRNSTSLHASFTSTTSAPTYYAMTLFEVPTARPVRADDEGISLERWYESYDGGTPITDVKEGELVRVRLRITTPRDREFVVIDDALPAGLEAVDLSLRTSASLPPFEGAPRLRSDMNEGPPGQRWLYGAWDSGWWTPWEHKEIRDDRVLYFARQLWKGSYQASYIARATTAGVFVRPPAQAEEMYNPAVRGRSDGGVFTVTRAPK